jgi:4-hydroxy-L-threonine phosphate dehydrogenase PdxA
MFCPRIAITCGEPAGVGPEISVRAALETADSEIVLIGVKTFDILDIAFENTFMYININVVYKVTTHSPK